jgi:hypothetical protein
LVKIIVDGNVIFVVRKEEEEEEEEEEENVKSFKIYYNKLILNM